MDKGKLTVGVAAFALATFLAVASPASGYELSIYASTPSLVWIFFGATGAVGSYLLIRGRNVLGVLLIAACIYLIVLLPVLRGYWMVGQGDVLTHTGIVKDMSTGPMSRDTPMYPMVHIIAVVIGLLGVPLNTALLIVSYLVAGIYLVSIPLLVVSAARGLDFINRQPAQIAGSISALLLLPVNHIGTKIGPHPTSLASLLWAPFLLVTYIYIQRRDRRWAVVLISVLIMLLLAHPLHSALAGMTLAAATVAAFGGRELLNENSMRGPLIPAIIIGALTLEWGFRYEQFTKALSVYIVQFFTLESTGQTVGAKSASLSSIGGSVFELGLKLFGVNAIFGILSLMLLVYVAYRYKQGTSRVEPLAVLGAGVVPVVVMAAVGLVLQGVTISMRFVGVLMVFVTVGGALFLAWAVTELNQRSRPGTTVITAVLLVALVVTIPVIHPSPYMYRNSGHISAETIEGIQNAPIEPGESYWSVGTSANRVFQAANGASWVEENGLLVRGSVSQVNLVPHHFANQSLPEHFGADVYLIVFERDRIIETELQAGFQFNESDFQYLESDPQIIPIYRHDSFDIYLIHGSETIVRVPEGR